MSGRGHGRAASAAASPERNGIAVRTFKFARRNRSIASVQEGKS